MSRGYVTTAVGHCCDNLSHAGVGGRAGGVGEAASTEDSFAAATSQVGGVTQRAIQLTAATSLMQALKSSTVALQPGAGTGQGPAREATPPSPLADSCCTTPGSASETSLRQCHRRRTERCRSRSLGNCFIDDSGRKGRALGGREVVTQLIHLGGIKRTQALRRGDRARAPQTETFSARQRSSTEAMPSSAATSQGPRRSTAPPTPPSAARPDDGRA